MTPGATMGRPSTFEVLLDVAHAMWAPVFHELSLEDLERLDNLPYDEALYRDESDEGYRILSEFDVQRSSEPSRSDINWITAKQINLMHDRLISAFGGEPGTRNPAAIEGYISRAKKSRVHGHDPFPSVFDKAAYLMRSILVEHPYVDGQKRTGLATAFVFLGMNHYALWARSQMDEVHFAVEVAKGKKEVPEISSWLQDRVAPLRVGKGSASLVRILGGKHESPRCFNCGRFLCTAGYKAACLQCQWAYEYTARAVGVAEAPEGTNIEAKIGLHKTGEGPEVIAQFLVDEVSRQCTSLGVGPYTRAVAQILVRAGVLRKVISASGSREADAAAGAAIYVAAKGVGEGLSYSDLESISEASRFRLRKNVNLLRDLVQVSSEGGAVVVRGKGGLDGFGGAGTVRIAGIEPFREQERPQ